jgi:hypothetical protein
LCQRFSELNEPIHLRGPHRRDARLSTHLLALADLMYQEYDGQDDEAGDKLQASAMVDLTRAVEQRPELAGRDNPDRYGKSAQQKGIVPSENAHLISAAGGICCSYRLLAYH